MKINIILRCIILFMLCSTLYSREGLKIAIITLDDSLIENEELRKEIVRNINRFPYLKQKTSISVDKKKKSLFGTNELTLEQGLIVASNLNVKVAIIIKSDKIPKNTNDNNIKELTEQDINYINQLINTTNSNELDTILSNYKITNIMLSNNIILTNGENDLIDLIKYYTKENTEKIDKIKNNEIYDIVYKLKVIDIETENVLKEYENKSFSTVITAIQEICTYLEFYFSSLIIKTIELPINSINVNFRIERITLENKTNIINSSGDIIEGESFNINFRSNKEGYIYIFAFQNDGNVILMYPNDFNNYNYINDKYENKINAKKNYIIPPENSMFNIVVGPPFGEDAFYLLYIEKEQKWITGLYFKGDGFMICEKNKVAEFTIKLKNILKKTKNDDWQMYRIYLNSMLN